jgi:hypothetical protein
VVIQKFQKSAARALPRAKMGFLFLSPDAKVMSIAGLCESLNGQPTQGRGIKADRKGGGAEVNEDRSF